MNAYIFYSGSKGNCTYITDGDTSILVDAGGCLKRIRESLARVGGSLETLDGIFVTHEHTDHVKALKNIVKKSDARIFTSLETARAVCTPSGQMTLDECRLVASSVMTVKPERSYEIGTISVYTFPTSHDTAGSLGFVFKSTKDDVGIGYATDMGCVTDSVKRALLGVRNIVIESNHDVEMLKTGPYPEYLKSRILSERGHLSNADCGALVRDLYDGGARSFTLAHLSEENNLPALALETVRASLGARDGYTLNAASAYEMTEIVLVEE